jgi:hypothetical protein
MRLTIPSVLIVRRSLRVRGALGADFTAETELKDAAWYYPDPKEKAKNIKDYVAFCKLHDLQLLTIEPER